MSVHRARTPTGQSPATTRSRPPRRPAATPRAWESERESINLQTRALAGPFQEFWFNINTNHVIKLIPNALLLTFRYRLAQSPRGRRRAQKRPGQHASAICFQSGSQLQRIVTAQGVALGQPQGPRSRCAFRGGSHGQPLGEITPQPFDRLMKLICRELEAFMPPRERRANFDLGQACGVDCVVGRRPPETQHESRAGFSDEALGERAAVEKVGRHLHLDSASDALTNDLFGQGFAFDLRQFVFVELFVGHRASGDVREETLGQHLQFELTLALGGGISGQRLGCRQRLLKLFGQRALFGKGQLLNRLENFSSRHCGYLADATGLSIAPGQRTV